MTDPENRLIALAVATCTAERDITHGYPDDNDPVLGCDLPAGHDGPFHYDPVDGVLWAAAVPNMTRDQAEAAVRRLVTA